MRGGRMQTGGRTALNQRSLISCFRCLTFDSWRFDANCMLTQSNKFSQLSPLFSLLFPPPPQVTGLPQSLGSRLRFLFLFLRFARAQLLTLISQLSA